MPVGASSANEEAAESRRRDEKLIYTFIVKMDYRNLKIHLHNSANRDSDVHGSTGQTGAAGSYLDITKIFDKKGLTPLHFAAFQNSLKCAQILCEHVRQHGDGRMVSDSDKQEYLTHWVNMHSLCEDSFTPLHFASFFGNISLIKYLLSQGANPRVTNACDINMLHVGAQGDQPISIAYFLTLGLDINSLDKRFSTPLHWAAFAGADLAL